MTCCLTLLLLYVPSQLAFERHVLDSFPAGYQAAVADLNSDHKPDVVVLSTQKDRVVWYENPAWQQHPVATTARNIDMAPHDVDGDGRPELALATGFYFDDAQRGGEIFLLKQPAEGSGLWPKSHVATDPVVHRLRWGDLDGDGDAELLHAPIFGPGSTGAKAPQPAHLWAFHIPSAASRDQLRIWKIDETLTVLHGLWVEDLDGDHRDELLTASFEGIHRFDAKGSGSDLAWKKTLIAPGAPASSQEPGTPRGTSEVITARLAGDQLTLAAIEPWHGHQVVVYLPERPWETWRRLVLDDQLQEGHALVAANLDGDSDEEIVAGWRGGAGGIKLYDPSAGRYESKWLDHAIAVESIVVADLNTDGKQDLVAVGGRSNLVVWYENKSN